MVNAVVQTFEAFNLPTKHVTVYGDRAEVNKVAKVHLKSGVNEVVVTKLSRSLDSESIRVEGFGKASITEVKFQEKKVVKDEDVKENEKDLHNKIKKLKEDRKSIEQHLDCFKRQKEVLEGVANQIARGQASTDKEKEKEVVSSAFSFLTEDSGTDNLEKFLDYYTKRSALVDDKLNEYSDKLETINEEINVADGNLSDAYRARCSFIKEVTIYVSSSENGEASLDLFYVVRNASWKPTYDVRVQTQEAAMQVTYYGLIEQDTDEEWKDAKLTLSTATPRIGGQVPEIGTKKISFYKPPPPQQPRPQPVCYAGEMSYGAAVAESVSMRMAFEEAPKLRYVEAAVKENVTSTAFEIDASTTIPSDNSSHKVTIAVVDLKPTFEYESVPSKSTYAYFKAKSTNSSQYPFLAGPTAIFVNQSFVANGSMKSVNPSEQFDVSLGVDASIKIEYKAAKKFNEESGILSKSSVLTQEQKIGLHNTKADAVRLTIIEPLPQSTEEKLKVTLLEPALNKTDKQVFVNKQNNVEWQLSLQPNEKRDLVLKYQIEHPKGEQLEYKEE